MILFWKRKKANKQLENKQQPKDSKLFFFHDLAYNIKSFWHWSFWYLSIQLWIKTQMYENVSFSNICIVLKIETIWNMLHFCNNVRNASLSVCQKKSYQFINHVYIFFFSSSFSSSSSNCLNSSCASFGEKKNEIGCVVFALISINWHLGGLEKNDLPLKSPRNKIIQILFQQC